MTDDARQPAQGPSDARAVRLVSLPPAALAALLEGDLPGAGAATGVDLPEYFVDAELRPVWRVRLEQLACAPESVGWSAHVVLAEPEGTAIGHGGFHGPPDRAGRVEVGYSVAPAHRRRGFAKAILAELLRRAEADSAVITVRATIHADNTASMATIAGFGFTQVAARTNDAGQSQFVFEATVARETSADSETRR